MFDLISVKEITFLKDLDYRITINKNGKFCYYKFLNINSNTIWRFFLFKLIENKVYTVIPFISVNNKPDEPYIVLTQQFLISTKSDLILISNFIINKISDTVKLYNIHNLNDFNIIFKFKEVEIVYTTFSSNWMEFLYPLNNQIITKDLIKNSLQLFWTQIINKELISEDKVFCYSI